MIQLLANLVLGSRARFLLAIALLAPSCGALAGPPPQGSYTQTCSSIQVNGTTLSASCSTMQNSTNNTTLDNFSQCVGDIANFAGNLTCSNTNIPAGSYQLTCRFTWAWKDSSNNVTLNSNCQTMSGAWNSSQLATAQKCAAGSDIANFDGYLACTAAPGVHAAVPVGSYTKSCRFIWMFNDTINAECQTISGGWVQSQVNWNCTVPLINFNGVLVCSSVAPPGGSFAQSCGTVWVDGNGNLNAECKTGSGSENVTQLANYTQCIGDIANYDGVLACNKGGQAPTGSYLQTCRYTWFDGTAQLPTLHAECQTMTGAWQATALADVNLCPGNSVTNLDGALACNLGSPHSGSYTQTCRNLWSLNGTLHAECKNEAGGWLTTSLGQFAQCSGDIANINGILQCASFSTPPLPPSFVVAGMVLHDQEQGNWCWASTGEMVMGYFGTPLTQCQEVKTEKGLGNCCGFPIFALPYLTDSSMNCQGCNCGGYPPYTAYGHSGTNSGAALSFQQLQQQVAGKNKPFSFAWNWCGGGAHVLVVIGYATVGGNQVWIMDPMNPEPYLISYDEWSSNPNNNGTCSANDPYNHAFQGNEYDIQ